MRFFRARKPRHGTCSAAAMPFRSWLRRLAKNRLFVFAILGGGLYALTEARAERRVVEVDPAVLASLRDAQAKKAGVRELEAESRREVDARAIEDEILYREALRMGLDRDDPVIRQRLVQKLLLLVEDMGGASRDPSREELEAYFHKSPERWRRPPRYHVVHVFASHAESLPPAVALAGATEPPTLGEPFPYPRACRSSRDELARIFGPSFAAAIVALPTGAVSEPIRSSFGWHRARLVERSDGAPATFEEVEKDVLLEYLLGRREEVVGEYLHRTFASYDIRLGGEKIHVTPTRRVAARVEGSAED
jgi:hypothetical protein